MFHSSIFKLINEIEIREIINLKLLKRKTFNKTSFIVDEIQIRKKINHSRRFLVNSTFAVENSVCFTFENRFH